MRAKILIAAIFASFALVFMAGCRDKADVASENISKAADNFEVNRRIVFVNGITDKYLLTIEGFCNIEDDGNQLEVTCKAGPDKFYKDFLGLSDNVTYFVEQGDPIDVDEYHYRVTFAPEQIIPDIRFNGTPQGETPPG